MHLVTAECWPLNLLLSSMWKGEKLTDYYEEPPLHGSLTFLHVLQTETLTDFILHHHFKNICISDSLRKRDSISCQNKGQIYPVQWRQCCPGWCGSVGWMLSCKLRGCWFNSWSGHMPRLRVQRQPINVSLSHRCLSLSLLPSLLNKNNINL